MMMVWDNSQWNGKGKYAECGSGKKCVLSGWPNLGTISINWYVNKLFINLEEDRVARWVDPKWVLADRWSRW